MGSASRNTVDQKRSSRWKRSMFGPHSSQWVSNPNKDDLYRKGVAEEIEWMAKAKIEESKYGRFPVVFHSGKLKYYIQVAQRQ